MGGRREEILNATLRVIARDGIDGIRSTVVAAEAGVSPPLLHYYYPTLDELVIAAYRYDAERLWDRLPVAGIEAGPIQRLHAGMTDLLTVPGPGLRSTLMVWHEFVRRAIFDEDVCAAVHERLQRWVDDSAALVALAQEEDAFPRGIAPRLAAVRFAALFAGVTAFELIGAVTTEWAERQMRDAVDGRASWRPVPAALRHPPQARTMPTPPEPTRDEQILDATLRRIGTTGVKGVHFPEIAAEAEVSRSLPRYYFRTIDELLAATMERLELLEDGRMAARAAQVADAEELLFDLLLFEVALDPGDMHDSWVAWNELLRLGCVDGAMRERAVGWTRGWQAQIAGQVRELQAAGRVPADVDPEEAAMRVACIAHGVGSALLIGLIDRDDYVRVLDWATADELRLA
ncbi:MAG: TetR/AcrR family transcriptional regulator [Gaiellales bacterium]